MGYLGAVLFFLIIALITPQFQAFMAGLTASTGEWFTKWAPFSYILALLLVAATFAGVYLVRNAPVRVDEENPMAKYRKEAPSEED